MATVTLRRSDLFPVGTTVGIYPRGSKNDGGPPKAAALASAAVDAAGLLTVTDAAIDSYRPLVAYALVNGSHNYASVRSTADTFGGALLSKRVGTSWPATVAARRAAAGTS